MKEYICEEIPMFDLMGEVTDYYTNIVAELIRCKDCQHYLAGKYCLNTDFYSEPTDFCSWAERKEE